MSFLRFFTGTLASRYMGPTTAFVITLAWASAGSISLDTVIAALIAGVAAEVLLGVFDDE